ncbi:MAG: lysophospholipid acyltransferase family protein [Tistlia sp.]
MNQHYLQVTDAVPKKMGDEVLSETGWFISALRTRLFELFVLIVSAFIGSAILLYLRWTQRPRQVRAVLRFWSRSFIFGARIILGVKYRVEGLENVPAGAVVFVGNHQSYWESIAMTAIVPDLNVVTKRAAMAIPVFGWGLQHAPMTPIDRDAPGRNIRRLVRQARASLASGRSMLIFPEGGRLCPRQRRPFARGLEILYRECNVPVVPFVTNAGLFWPAGFAAKRAGTITLRFLPQLAPGGEPRAFAAEIEGLLNEEKEKLLISAG